MKLHRDFPRFRQALLAAVALAACATPATAERSLLNQQGYKGSVGLQHYGIRGDAAQNLGCSMAGSCGLQARSGAEKVPLMPGGDLSAFKDKAAWFPVAEVGLDPKNAKKLIGKTPGDAAVLNGPGGRTGHLVKWPRETEPGPC